MRFSIRRGLDIPVSGAPDQTITDAGVVSSVAVTGLDYVGLKPRLHVEIGHRVRQGDTLFVDKRDPDVRFVAPGGGTIAAINRGARRVLQSIVIDLDGDEHTTFTSYERGQLATLDRARVRQTLLESGMWTALRERPFNRVAPSNGAPSAVFVTAIDTQPLAPDPAVVIADAGDAFDDGISVLTRLTEQPVYVCTAAGGGVLTPASDRIQQVEFDGPHPAGLVGTHIHFVDPIQAGKSIWHIGYQDVIAIGRLFTTGRFAAERVLSLGGPRVMRPRLLRTRLGASTDDLIRDELESGPTRVVSGSLLNGRHAAGWARHVGRYHLGIAAIPDAAEREFLGWFVPGLKKFSANRIYLASLLPGRKFALNTSAQGSPRAIVPVGHYEKVMPLDILPTPLLKSLVVRDTATAQALGCLELDEEDLALCSLVCCSKQDYGAALRASLDLIEREGA